MRSFELGARVWRSAGRSAAPLLMGLGIVIAPACASQGSRFASAPRVVTNAPDVTTKNLPPDEEIDALLLGVRNVGKGNAVRVAVPPFRVLGSKNEWMGEAAALVAMSRLSREDGVSVLERGELTKIIELRRAQQTDDKQIDQLASTGKILGAQEILLGTIFDAGGGNMRVVVRPVRVEDGVSLASTEGEVNGEHWAADVERAFDSVVGTIVPSSAPGAASAVPALSAAELELGAKARQLQYQGDLTEAQALYARALAHPSSAWALEADYVRLMNDLGMTDWASNRAREVMDRMPPGTESLCARARLHMESTRLARKLADARLAVQLAASCGDRIVEAEALRFYASSVGPIDYRAANVAFARATALLGPPERNGWERCWLEYLRLEMTSNDGLDEGGGRSAGYQRIAKSCEAAGNLFIAAWAYYQASAYEWLPTKRTELLEHAVAIASRVGGTSEDTLLNQQAALLRSGGKPSAADELLLKVLGGRVNRIIALVGGLPETEAKLDAELLRRAGVTATAKSTQPIAESAKLLLKAHRISLAAALREWATRTDLDSVRQGKVYREIAEELDPPKNKAPANETDDARFDRAMNEQGLTLDRILQTSDPPLRGAVKSLVEASDVLWGRFWEVTKKKASPEERKRFVDAYERVAQWQGAPRLLGNAVRLRARVSFDGDKKDEARAALAKAHALAKDAAWYDENLAIWEAEFAADAAVAMQFRAARTVAAKRQSPQGWITALRSAAQLNTKSDESTCGDGLKALLNAADELEQAGAIEDAARALDAASDTVDECQHAGSGGSTAAAVALQERRAKVLDKLGDPLRSLQALNYILSTIKGKFFYSYRGAAERFIKTDGRANELVEQMHAGATSLANGGRWRDAARVAGSVSIGPAEVPAFLRDALTWTTHFEDSAEYLVLAANLERQIGLANDETSVRVKWLTAARDLFKRANDTPNMVHVQSLVLRRYSSDPEISREFWKCMDLAKSDAATIDDCVSGLGDAIIAFGGRTVRDRDGLKRTLKMSLDALPVWDTFGIDYRMELRTDVAMIAIVAGDMDAFRRVHDEVVSYYTKTAPSAYLLATHYARVAIAARTNDVPLYLRMMHGFHDAHGANAFWESADLVGAAEAAHAAKLFDEERFFKETGRSIGYAPYAHRWARLGWGQLLAERKFVPALKMLEDARKLTAGRSILYEDYTSSIAQVHALAGDLAGARSALKPVVERIARQGTSSQSPCFDSMIQETEASLAMATHDCRVGTEMRQSAAATRLRCTGSTSLDDGNWSDGIGQLEYRAANACGAAFVPYVAFFAGVANHEWPGVYRLGCDRGDFNACNALADALRFGDDVAKDSKTATELLRKACNAGQPSACERLATMMIAGDGMAKDEPGGYAIMRQACDGRYRYACTREGELLLAGTGTAIDRAHALERFELACKLSSTPGCELYIENGGKP